MAILPTEPIYSKLLLVSVKHEYLSITNHISAIVAMLSVENIFFNPSGLDNDDKILKKRLKILSPCSDHLSLYNILHGYRQLMKKSKSSAKSYCREFYLNQKSI